MCVLEVRRDERRKGGRERGEEVEEGEDGEEGKGGWVGRSMVMDCKTK